MMLFKSCPQLLVLALSLPGTSLALGLGNMRVDSRLDEPLSAQIDIIGATPDELKALRAAVASPELFGRYQAQRPAFLSSTTITVGTDAAGKAVLNIQSADAFNEPLVELLIDVHWGKEELVRDYSLLLDPRPAAPRLSAKDSGSADATSAPAAVEPLTEIPHIVLPSPQISFPSANRLQVADAVLGPGKVRYRVVAHDTLRGIVRRAGARSEAQQQRMMLAIFRTNPQAFTGNINLVHSGALIDIPSPAEIKISPNLDVGREIRAQMAAWRHAARASPDPLTARSRFAQPGPPSLTAPIAARPGGHNPASVSTVTNLDDRMEFLQKTLAETNRQLAIKSARLVDMERARSASAPSRSAGAAAQVQHPKGTTSLSALLMALALLGGALVYAGRRFLSGRSAPQKASRAEEPTAEEPAMAVMVPLAASSAGKENAGYTVAESRPDPVATAPFTRGNARLSRESADAEATLEMTQAVGTDVASAEECGAGDAEQPDMMVLRMLEPLAADAVGTVLDYNLSDLDGRVQHVEMPGSLHDHVVVVERRKNAADALMAAIQRDPTRNDLRMKLLEILHSTALKNLHAFKEVVRDLASNPERLKAAEWDQVIAMGRQIAADDALFAEPPSAVKVADCA